MNAAARVVAPNTIATSDGAHLFYRDWGQGEPVVFVAGWSLPSDSWSYQMLALGEQGARCIAFDRRGHGRSCDTGSSYDFDILAGDIFAVLEALDLKRVTLIGHSMGCNEIVRYLTLHGSNRVARIALLGTMTPGVVRSPTNPDGIDGALFDQFRREQLKVDFPLWLDQNMEAFVPGSTAGMQNWLRQMALNNSLQALHDCHLAVTSAAMEDELAAIEIPVLLVAGDLDVSAPIDLTSRPSARLIPDVRLTVIEGAAHGMFLTHGPQVNSALLEFIGQLS